MSKNKEKPPKKIVLSVGGYELTHYPHSKKERWWFCNEDGEGMGMDDKDVYRMFDEFFKENF